MVIQTISGFFSKSSNSVRGTPLYNNVPYTTTGTRANYGGTSSSYKQFWKQFKRSSELLGVISIPVTDIIGDRPAFLDVNGQPLGRNKLMRALKFWRDNRVKENIKSQLFDSFITGDGYLFKNKISTEQVKEAIHNYSKFMSKEAYDLLQFKTLQDEQVKTTRSINYVASSTVDIEHDEVEIKKYVQRVNGRQRFYEPKEIIHMRYLDLDGKVQGFSPVEALSAEIHMLYMIKENMIAFLNNGGTPSKMFVLPDELANSQNHRFMVETLQRYKMVQNRNGNLVFTGNVQVEDLAGNPRDLEYQNLALWTASNIAFAYGIPISRIPYLIGSSATSGDNGGLAESGYWNKISEIQDQLEDILNSQLFEELGFHIRFNRKYKQDEVREAQTFSMNADTVTKIEAMLKPHGKKLSPQFISQTLNIPLTEFEEIPEDEKMNEFESTGLMNQNLLDNNEVQKEPDNRKRANTKRNTVNQSDVKGASV